MMSQIVKRPINIGHALFGLLALLAGWSLNSQAQEIPRFQLSGFASVVGGRVLSGSTEQNAGIPGCAPPCYIADWYNGGFYKKSLSFTPESRIGVQGTYVVNPQFSATAQITSRAVDTAPRLEWAFLSYKLGDWDLQLGRKRIPMAFYSDFQDIGVAYPWVAPPPDVYGWEASNYNGFSARYRTSAGGVGISGSLFTGAEKVNDARIYTLSTTERVDVDWTNLIGADLELSKDWWTVRFAYFQSKVRADYRESNFIENQQMKTYAMAFNADFGRWFWLSEVGNNVRDSADQSVAEYKVFSVMGSLGYRLGAWTPHLTATRFHEYDAGAGYDAVSWNTYSLGLRYDISAHQALKVELNKTDDTVDRYTGDATVLRVSYDHQF